MIVLWADPLLISLKTVAAREQSMGIVFQQVLYLILIFGYACAIKSTTSRDMRPSASSSCNQA